MLRCIQGLTPWTKTVSWLSATPTKMSAQQQFSRAGCLPVAIDVSRSINPADCPCKQLLQGKDSRLLEGKLGRVSANIARKPPSLLWTTVLFQSCGIAKGIAECAADVQKGWRCTTQNSPFHPQQTPFSPWVAARDTSLGLQSLALPFWDRASLVIQPQSSKIHCCCWKASSHLWRAYAEGQVSHFRHKRETTPWLICFKAKGILDFLLACRHPHPFRLEMTV